MLRPLSFLFLSGAVALGAAAAPAAEPERLTIPLSDPAKPARVEVGLVMGSITVVAGKAGEVVLVATTRQDEDEDEHEHFRDPDEGDDESERRRSRAGMRRIQNASLGLQAEEKGNRVEIGVESWARPIDLRLEVPAASSLELSSVNDGELSVTGISGEVVLNNTNGGITVRDATGPVNAATVNGDLVVEFGRTVDPAISDRVLALDDALGADPPEGLRERVPTYRSLMLHYDPLVLDRGTLAERVRALAAGATARAASPTLWTLPCCYDAAHGEDVAQVAERSGLSPETVVSTHAATTFRVYMYGFAPGFAA